MSPEQKRKFNTLFGSVFLASGVLAWGLAAYYAFTPNPPRPAPVYADNVVDLQSCARTLRTLGYPEVSVQKDDVIANEALGGDAKAQMERATLAATVCKLELKYFCIGESCPQPGITVVTTKPKLMRTAKTEAPAAAAAAAKASNPRAAGARPGAAAPKGKPAAAPAKPQ
ncbi:hypothetical protein D3C71_23040 [compost metagenome]